MKFQAEINQLMTLLSMHFMKTKKFSSLNSSHTDRMNVIKFYMNHLKM
jgi:hypothetical protein